MSCADMTEHKGTACWQTILRVSARHRADGEFAVQMKQTEAAAFVNTIKGPQWGGDESTVAVNVDPGMLAAMQRATLISPAWLAACTATMGTSLNSMAVLAANNNTMQVNSYEPPLCLHTSVPSDIERMTAHATAVIIRLATLAVDTDIMQVNCHCSCP